MPTVVAKVNVPFSSGEETLVIAGTIPSIIIALFALNEDAVPGTGRLRLALLPAMSSIVPLFKDSPVSLT